MQVSFDLISDLHVDTWSEPFDWTGRSTSMIAVVAGDIARDRSMVKETLSHLAHCYQAVLYIDGNDEHRYNLHDLDRSYKTLRDEIGNIENIIYLRDNVAVIDGVAFVGATNWWTYDFDEPDSYDESRMWFSEHYKVDYQAVESIERTAMTDCAYLCNSVGRLQRHTDVKRIVVVTHTVPMPELIQHDVELQGSHRLNCTGNAYSARCLSEDTERKISHWVFGHYHSGVDRIMNGVHYLNNARGRGDTPWKQSVYHPRKIVIEF